MRRPRRHRWLLVSVFLITYSVFQAVLSTDVENKPNDKTDPDNNNQPPIPPVLVNPVVDIFNEKIKENQEQALNNDEKKDETTDTKKVSEDEDEEEPIEEGGKKAQKESEEEGGKKAQKSLEEEESVTPTNVAVYEKVRKSIIIKPF